MKEEKVNSNYIYQGRIINLRKDEVRLVNGKIVTREVVEHLGAVAILAIKDNHIYLVKQFRYPFEEELLEIIAGKLEINESPFDTAIRELIEEAGIIPDRLISLGKIYPSPGYGNEIIHLFFTDEFEITDNSPDEDEFLETHVLHINDVLRMIDEGKIVDAKTIAAIYKYQRMNQNDK